MRWTVRKPTEEGRYLCRFAGSDDNYVILNCFLYHDRLCLERFGDLVPVDQVRDFDFFMKIEAPEE